MGTLEGEPKSKSDMIKYAEEWSRQASAASSIKEIIDFHTEQLKDMVDSTDYRKEALLSYGMFIDWMKHREQGILKYRDNSFCSIYTGRVAPQQKPFMDIIDDSVHAFLNNV